MRYYTRFFPSMTAIWGIVSTVVLYFILSTMAVADNVLIYRWLDPVDGDIHYSESAPSDVPYEMVVVEPAPPPDPDMQKRLDEMEKIVDEGIKSRELRAEKQRQKAVEAAKRKLDCARVKDWLAKLESRPGPKLLIMDKTGQARRMTEEVRQQKLTEAKDQATALCTPEQ